MSNWMLCPRCGTIQPIASHCRNCGYQYLFVECGADIGIKGHEFKEPMETGRVDGRNGMIAKEMKNGR